MSAKTHSAEKIILVEYMWAIMHTRGWTAFYYGTYPSRKDAIEDHIKQCGGTWKHYYRKGDRAVRVAITDDFLGLVSAFISGTNREKVKFVGRGERP